MSCGCSEGLMFGGGRKLLTNMTKAELYSKAKLLKIPNRSKMTKDQLASAIRKLNKRK